MSPINSELDLLTTLVLGMRLLKPAAYLDPGSGSYLLQLLIAGALGALFALRLYWKRVREFLSGFLQRSSEDEAEGDSQDQIQP